MLREFSSRGLTVGWAIASTPMPGEEVSGDGYCLVPRPSGLLAVVVDALGHGPGAGRTAQAAIEIIEGSGAATLPTLFRECHAGLAGTRGVVMSAAWYEGDDQAITWLAVGNVDGCLIRADKEGRDGSCPTPPASPHEIYSARDRRVTRKESLLMRGGVVGYQLPALRPATVPVRPGDLLVLATDGVRLDVTSLVRERATLQEDADRILSEGSRNTDDALVLLLSFTAEGIR